MWGGALGGSCEFDERNRPVSIAYWLHVSIKDKLVQLEGQPNKNTYLVGLSTHEVNHGLGFNIGQFLQANVVTLIDVFDKPKGDPTGVKEDALWHFKKETRVSQLAKVHYDCWDEDAWDGVPLMGGVEGGRDSHQNSFIMLEDVESYGPDLDLNTPFTLAALEDTGHYLANYSKSDFPNWGAYQGCDFITTRCRTRGGTSMNNFYQVVGGDQSQCDRDFKTNLYSKFNKCATTNCGQKDRCHPECVVLTSSNADAYRQVRPVMNGTNAMLGAPASADLMDKLEALVGSELFQLLLPVIVWIVVFILLCVLRKLCCSQEEGMIRFSHCVSGLFLFFGVTMLGVAIYMYVYKDVFFGGGGMLSEMGVYFIAAFGLFVALQSWMQWKCATGTNKSMYKCTAFTANMLLLIQVLVMCWLIIYNMSLDDVEDIGEGGGKWDNHAFGFLMKPVESYFCESYRNCCRDPRMVEDDTFVCTTSHEGTTSTLMSDETDPSRSMFCEYISGQASTSVGAIRGVSKGGCDALGEIITGFNRAECQAEFCAAGVGGYESFLKLIVAAFRRNYYYIAGVTLALIILQLEQVRGGGGWSEATVA